MSSGKPPAAELYVVSLFDKRSLSLFQNIFHSFYLNAIAHFLIPFDISRKELTLHLVLGY